MALAPRSQEFFEVRKTLEKLIEDKVLTSEEQYEEVLRAADIEPEEYEQVEKDYLENRKLIEYQVKGEQEGLTSYIPDPLTVLAPAASRLGTGLKNLFYTMVNPPLGS